MQRKLQVLAAVACALWVSAASAAPSVVEVRLAIKEPAQVDAVGEVQAGGVMRLRPVHSDFEGASAPQGLGTHALGPGKGGSRAHLQ